MKILKKIIQNLIGFLFILGLILGIAIYFSPYKKQKSEAKNTVAIVTQIKAPIDSVFAYLGNSSNADDWSSFVDHISVLNPAEVPDGSVGSFRRCFEKADESGMTWDEEIVSVVPSKNRKLTIFNMQHFSIQAEGLATEQRYKKLSNNKTELTFVLYFDQNPVDFLDQIKMHLASYKIASIFEQNLANIKKICEEKFATPSM
jgi:hypothetical protein